MDFVVGVLSFFENEIELEKISAESEKEALMKHSLLNGYTIDEDASLEKIYDDLFNCDIAASVIKI